MEFGLFLLGQYLPTYPVWRQYGIHIYPNRKYSKPCCRLIVYVLGRMTTTTTTTTSSSSYYCPLFQNDEPDCRHLKGIRFDGFGFRLRFDGAYICRVNVIAWRWWSCVACVFVWKIFDKHLSIWVFVVVAVFSVSDIWLWSGGQIYFFCVVMSACDVWLGGIMVRQSLRLCVIDYNLWIVL